MQSARHKTVQHASTYLRDALTRFARLKRNRFTKDETVSPWESIYSEPNNPDDEPITPDTCLRQPLPQLAHWWYVEIVHYSADGPVPSCFTLSDVAIQQQKDAKSSLLSIEDIENRLIETSNSSLLQGQPKREAMRVWLHKYRTACINTHETFMAQPPTPATPAVRADDHVDVEVNAKNSKKRVRKGSLEIEERKRVKTAEGEEKVSLVLTAYKKWKERVNLLIAKDQTWFHNSVKNVGACVETCYGGDVARFVLQNPKLAISKYKCQCGN
jgi:hypothetical protein